MVCKKCVLPESDPCIHLDEDGICNICREYESREREDSSQKKFLETELVRQLKKYKRKATGKYDCLVLCSGGKDSTMSLYYMKERYHLEPLAFTFNHGFESEQAVKNIKNAVKRLEIDWMYYKSSYMNSVFSDIVENHPEVSICHVCTLWYINLSFDIASRFNIPIVVGGWTKGQSLERGEHGREYKVFSGVTKDYINNHLRKKEKYKDFPRELKEVKKRFKGLVTSPHWYIPWDVTKVTSVLTQELNWKPIDLSYPEGSTNCLLNFASVYLSMKYYGFTHYHIEMAKLIRKGELTRDEALKKLEVDFDKKFVNKILRKIGCQIN